MGNIMLPIHRIFLPNKTNYLHINILYTSVNISVIIKLGTNAATSITKIFDSDRVAKFTSSNANISTKKTPKQIKLAFIRSPYFSYR